MTNSLSRNLVYPIYLVEDRKRPEFSTFNVVYGKTGYITSTRVPDKNKFTQGTVFDSGGLAYRYSGECGWPRFAGWTKIVVEG